jgi:hypothetical protein
MTDTKVCSQCGSPLSTDRIDTALCERCTPKALPTHENATSPAGAQSLTGTVNEAKTTPQTRGSSTFLDDMLCETGKALDLAFKTPYAGLAIGLWAMRMWKAKQLSWGTMATFAGLLLAAFATYGFLLALYPRAKRFLTEVPIDGTASSPATPRPAPPPPALDSWWLLHDGRPTGPHPIVHLMDAVDKGDFSLDALVCPVGGQQWSALGSVLPPRIPNAATSSNAPAAS